jgi:DNA repair exonuclease SbcCD nuclease subunit
MNLLFFSDIHVCSSAIEECDLIFNEIINLVNQYNVDTVISLGDNFDNNKPSAIELNCLANFIKKLDNKKIILLAAQSHESETLELSSVDIYGILNNNVSVMREYIDENYLYCGHFTLSESKMPYGAKRSKNDFKQYKYVLLGHIHTYQLIDPNACHLGSTRYVNFDEVNDKKVVLLIENYKEESEKCHFLALKSPYGMRVISLENVQPRSPSTKSVEEGIVYLNQLSAKIKIKVIIKDFVSYKKWLSLSATKGYDKKFVVFKCENDFELASQIAQTKTETKDLAKSFEQYCEEKKIDNELKTIIQEELK